MNQKLIMTALAAAIVGIASTSAMAGPKCPGGFAPCKVNCGGGGGGGKGPGGFSPTPPGGGGGGGGWGWGGGFGIHINPGYHGGGGYYEDDRISCRRAKNIVRRKGYKRVRTDECNGGIYTFRGKRGSRHYRIKVDAYEGYIVSRRRL